MCRREDTRSQSKFTTDLFAFVIPTCPAKKRQTEIGEFQGCKEHNIRLLMQDFKDDYLNSVVVQKVYLCLFVTTGPRLLAICLGLTRVNTHCTVWPNGQCMHVYKPPCFSAVSRCHDVTMLLEADTALWACSLGAFSSIPDGSRGLS